jgi:DNA-binding transcriptional ArsR family regulator
MAALAPLADPTRLRLLEELAGQRRDSALCVGALAARLGVSQPAISQHLRVLRSLGLVRAERCGMRVHYRLDRPRLGEILGVVQQFLERLAAEPEADGNVCADAAANCCADPSGGNPLEVADQTAEMGRCAAGGDDLGRACGHGAT